MERRVGIRNYAGIRNTESEITSKIMMFRHLDSSKRSNLLRGMKMLPDYYVLIGVLGC